MAWTDAGSPGAATRVGTTRPRMLQNGLATERHLLPWIRTLLYLVTIGLLMSNVVLHLWHRRGDLWKDSGGGTWGPGAAGFAVMALGSAVLVLAVITDGVGIRHWSGSGTPRRFHLVRGRGGPGCARALHRGRPRVSRVAQ
jgi:uncharacterized membrane protein YidH (DUF202 family)